MEACQGGDGGGGDEMLTLLLECWKTHFNHEEEIRCCLSYLIVGKGVRGHVHGGAVWSARGPLSHGRDNKVQTRAKKWKYFKASKVSLGNLFNGSLSSTRGTYQEQKIELFYTSFPPAACQARMQTLQQGRQQLVRMRLPARW